ncbi:DNA replication/repair protein RecF [Elusimicrobiota bacterium]
MKELFIKNYRNHALKRLKFTRKSNIITGNNGIGKTNILESVYMLSTTASHKTGNNTELIKEKEKGFNLKALIADKIGEKEIEIKYERFKGMKTLINGTNVSKTEYLQNFPAVFFSPEDIEILRGSSSELRRLINISLSQLNPLYAKILIRYSKINKERNAVLRSIKKRETKSLKIWTELLKKESIKISNSRKKFIEYINKYLQKLSSKMNINEKYKLCYKPNLYSDNYIRRDLEKKYTTWGAHRDIFYFSINENNMKYFGSRGELRMAAFLFKMSLWKLIKSKTGKNPIIILDDVFSELDMGKRNKIISNMEKTQILMSTTYIPEKIDISANIINL